MLGALFLLLASNVAEVHAQASTPQRAGEWAWRPLFDFKGVTFDYIYYDNRDGMRGGVVMRLHNANDFGVRYRFKVVFRSGETARVAEAEGALAPGEIKTGASSGLYWMPFADDRPLTDLGLRGFSVEPVDPGE